MQVLENITTQFERVEEIKAQLPTIKLLKLHTGLEGFNSPESYGVYKDTGGNALGVVGKIYEPTQPKFLFDNFTNSLIEVGVDLLDIEYTELKGGSKIMFSAPIGSFGYKNLQGKDDEMLMKLNVATGFDGSTKTSMFLSTYRMICANGMKSWKTEFQISFKNTRNNVGKVDLMCNDIVKAMEHKKSYMEFLEYLTKKQITPKEHNEFIKRVTGYDLKEYNDLNTRARNILDKINECVAIEQNDAGNTAWALLNGITRYTNHEVKKTYTDTLDYIYVGQGSNLNELAQQVVNDMFVMN